MAESSSTALAAAQAEWAEVDRRQAEAAATPSDASGAAATSAAAAAKPAAVTTDAAEALAHLRKLAGKSASSSAAADAAQLRAPPKRRRRRCPSLFACCCGSGGGLDAAAAAELDEALRVAKLPMRPADDAEACAANDAILRGVLAGLRLADGCWEAAGFQGSDPATDLRGVGMFGALQMLHIVARHSALAHALLRDASDDPARRFPLAATLLNVTRFVLEAARSGALDRLLNARGGVFGPANDLYCAAAFELHRVWARGDKTILDMGQILKALQKRIADAPEKLLADFAAAAATSDLARH